MTQHEFWVLTALVTALFGLACGYGLGYARAYRRGLVRGMNSQQRQWEDWLSSQEPRPLRYEPDEYGWMEAGHPATQKAEYGGRHRA